MSKEVEKCIEELQKESSDNNTKQYILLIKRCLDKLKEDEDLSKEEYLTQFLEDYKQYLKTDFMQTYKNIYVLSEYNSYKELLSFAKGNKLKFRKIIEEAKKQEATSNKDKLKISLNSEEQAILSMRDIIREFPKINEKELLLTLQKRKSKIAEILKKSLIQSIQEDASFLNEYGILDEYIEEANNELDELDLKELHLARRNIPADEYGDNNGHIVKYDEKKNTLVKYDENGKIVNDGDDLDKYYEDYGVIDMFSTECLEQLSPEDLMMMEMFWKSKYLEARMEFSKAMYVIRDLDLWNSIIENPESKIEELDNNAIINSLNGFNSLGQDTHNERENKKKRFLKRKNKKEKEKNVEDSKKQLIDEDEQKALSSIASDLVLEECVIVQKLKAKDFSVRSWGTIDSEIAELGDDQITIGIDNTNFRGTLLMSLPKQMLNSFLGSEDNKLPKYKDVNKLDSTYCSIMAKLYLPVSNYFKRQVMKKYKENPSSIVLANLVGKKVKPASDKNKSDMVK